MSEIKFPELPPYVYGHTVGSDDVGNRIYAEDAMQDYARAAVELDRASRPAGEAVAWLHDVVQSDGEQDQALSFSPDSFPLKGVGGFESIKSTPLFLAPQATHNKCDADFVALQIARRFVPYLEPQRRAQLQVAIRDAICKATPPPAVSEDVRELYEAASKGVHMSETCGPDGKYIWVSKFRSLEELHAYEDAWRAVMIGARPKFAHVQGEVASA